MTKYSGNIASANTKLEHSPDKDALEGLIDKYSLPEVLSVIATICSEKAEHLLADWQDTDTGTAWTRAAHVVEKASGTREVLGVGP